MAKRKKKKISKKKRLIKRIVLLVLSLIILIALIVLWPQIYKIIKIKGEAKSIVAESNYSTFKASATTVMYDKNGNQLCTMRNTKDLYYLNFNEIPDYIKNAFVIVEDKNFYKHSGIDIKGIIRAVVANAKSGDVEQGASTITQQLARNVFLSQEVTLGRKIKEAFIAVELEKKYSKDDILEFYLNNIYFANGYYGVEAAAKGYFSKSVTELTLSQQAFLAAIPNSPTRYDPIENYDATLERRNLVLKQMYEADAINTYEYESAIAEKITIEQEKTVTNNYIETYARRCATESMMAAYGFSFKYDFASADEYAAYKDSYDASYTLYQRMLLKGGYSVYTSIDSDIQTQLQKAVDDNLAGFTTLSNEGIYEMQGAATCIDNLTGNVVAIVGGRTQSIAGYSLNRAYQSYRQPGSSIKPLSVYTPYLQLGNTPDTVVVDEPIEGGPKNYNGAFDGAMTLRTAVQESKNTIAWKVYQEITPKAGSEYLMKMGYKKIYVDKNLVAGSLGGFTYGVTSEEMAGGFATLANDGVYRRATCVTTIVNTSGKTVVDETTRGTEVYEKNAVRMMTDMLKSVMTSGTGTAANISNAIVAGKTGTTNDDKDSWMVGFSKYYTTSVWAGYDMPQTIKNPGKYTKGIFKQFMTAVHAKLDVVDFPAYTTQSTQEQPTVAPTVEPTQAPTQAPTTPAPTSTTTGSTEKTTPSATTSVTKASSASATIQYGDQDAPVVPGDQNIN